MKSDKFRMQFFIALGFIVMLLLQFNFVLFWDSYYSHYPFLGNSQSTTYPPFFSISVRSLEITVATLFLVPLLALWFSRAGSLVATLGLLIGVMMATVIIWLSSEKMRQDSNMWPIDLVLLTIMTGAPLFLGCIAQVSIKFFAGLFVRDGNT